MTLDKLIEELQLAKEHCVPGNSEILIYKNAESPAMTNLLGTIDYVDFDNDNANIYLDEL